MIRWSKKTDFLSIRYPFILFCIYLLIVQFLKKPFITTGQQIGENAYLADTNIYFWMQFIVYIFVCTITSFYFEENFRKNAAQYIDVFKISTYKAVFLRYLRLILLLETVYIPFVVLSILKVNDSLTYHMEYFNTTYVLIDIAKPVFQCFAAMIFYITVSLFFTAVFRSRIYTMILLLTYAVIEATVFPRILGKYALFYGSFGHPVDLYSFFPVNVTEMIFLSAVMLAASLILHRFNKT